MCSRSDTETPYSARDAARHARNKRLVYETMQLVTNAVDADGVAAVLRNGFCAPGDDYQHRASHPFEETRGPDAVASTFWGPLLVAFPDLERRDDLVIGGAYEGADVVGCLGHLVGTFSRPWLDLPPTNKTLHLRFGEYHKFDRDGSGLVTQTTIILDVVDALQQMGYDPVFGASRGAEGRWDAPFCGSGVNLAPAADPAAGKATIDYILDMHAALMGFSGTTESELLSDTNPQKLFWHPKMMWFGPGGIGTCRGMDGFVRHHQMPFRTGFPKRAYGNQLRALGHGEGHYVRIGDGDFAGTGGWPSVVGTHGGAGWLNMEPTHAEVKMRVMDFYALHEGKIRENWVPIDVAHILAQMGRDVLAEARKYFANQSDDDSMITTTTAAA